MWSPIVFLSGETGCRCVVGLDNADSFGSLETWRYTRCPLTRRWQRTLGEKNRWCFYPVGQGECT